MTISNLIKKGRKFPKQVENAVGKGEIARYEQCFQMICIADMQKTGLVWERVKGKHLPLVLGLSRVFKNEINGRKWQASIFTFNIQMLTFIVSFCNFSKFESSTISDWLNHEVQQTA